MKLSRFSLVLLSLCLSSAVAAQHARATREGTAFFAPRHLSELETTAPNFGARVTGDLDGDGDLDLLMLEKSAGNLTPRRVQIWRNGGRGDFQDAGRVAFEEWYNHFTFSIAQFVFLADVTGDGWLDLVYERRGPGAQPPRVLVHPGLGNCGFATALVLQPGVPVDELAVGDGDGDGDGDLLVYQSQSSTLTWWRLEGASFVSSVPLVLPEALRNLATLDVDGDGSADAVAVSSAAGIDWIQVFRTVGGAPTLDEAIPLPSKRNGARLHAGDLEGDGDDDVLAVLYDHSTPPVDNVFHFLPILQEAGGFSAQALQSFQQPLGEAFLSDRDGALADWDEDGDLDYVSPLYGLNWMENTGPAHFELAARMVSSFSFGGSFGATQVVDLNGDGHLDVLANWTCFFGDGTFPARLSAREDWELQEPLWRSVEDWEGDGDLDLVSPTYLHLNNGDGSFAGRATPLPPTGTGGVLLEKGWGDFDGDGLRDFVAALHVDPSGFAGMIFYEGTEDGTYLPSPIVPSPVEMTEGLAGDLDGDGDLDILAHDGFWQNDGTGRFGSASVAAYAGRPLLARDFDADADLDLLVARAARLELLTNLGGLSFQLADLGEHVDDFVPRFLDLDEDGDLDLVIAQPSEGVVSVRERLPGGGFAPALELEAPDVNGPPGQIDVDGDGRLDLVAGARVAPFALLSAWIQGPGLTFSERRDWEMFGPALGFGDFDRDGDVEPIGWSRFENFRFDGPEDGVALQYGLDGATSGTGGLRPFLGSGGPVRPGRKVEFVIGRGRGGASGVLLRGSARADVVSGGFRNLIAAPEIVSSFVLGGTPGAAGAGSIVLRTPVVAALVGLTFDYQAVLVDPGASAGLSATNGLEVRFGDWPLIR